MLGTVASWALALIFLGYFIPHIIVAWFYKTKNLKKAYDAQWALVTGASSGEGGAANGSSAGSGAAAFSSTCCRPGHWPP